ncbi:hypothetical protein BH09PSE1_BH09PSE1_26570 [soil metagenome]
MDSESRDLIVTWRDMACANRDLAAQMEAIFGPDVASTYWLDADRFDIVANKRELAALLARATRSGPLPKEERRTVFGRRTKST